ncbi:MAG: winged helix-turn-helix transcriptional regulator [Acidimicrobiia bacterium]
MSRRRRYRLLCPIARALDHVGDRWTLLLLRDLHAGPARFTDLQSGLTGIASNLLAERLRDLESDRLIQRRHAEFGVTVYELTEFGESTGDLLFSLARIGAHFPVDEDLQNQGNLRSIAVTLKEALRRVIDPSTRISAGLLVDDEAFEIVISNGDVAVLNRTPTHVDATVATEYEPLMAVGDGELPLETFVHSQLEIVDGDPAKLAELSSLLADAFNELAVES